MVYRPKLDPARPPETIVEKWAYFFREAGDLAVVPPVLSEPPIVKALEAARTAGFTEEDEWDAYIRAGMAIQDERGALSLALKQGVQQGRLVEAKSALRRVLERRGLALTAEQEQLIDGCSRLETLSRWHDAAIVAATASEALQVGGQPTPRRQ